MFSVLGNYPLDNKPTLPRSCRNRVVFVWSLVFLGMALYTMVWFIMGLVLFPVIDGIEAAYTFPTPFDQVVAMLKNVFYWHPILAMLE
ncbi:hypothetical protein MUP77_03100 [Candidatus Bathyarchaeota archaeon]|nr:hypothetical protein [Candidatus Bathyarchaeota archaeon]